MHDTNIRASGAQTSSARLLRRRPLTALLAATVAVSAAPGLPGSGGAAPGSPPLLAQEAPYRGLPVEGGVTETALLLRRMGGVKRVLLIAAHPDDEDTALLAELARFEGARAAYMALTRGEGGQDLIGPQLGKGLGLIRTEELLAARRIDGAEQFFSRAYDFGFSKTMAESFGHWPRDTLLSDMVWVIRTFRPQVVVSIFSGTPADGHGQHQVAGDLTPIAFRLAADSTAFPEQLRWGARPWRAEKLYRRTWRSSDSVTLQIPTGNYDPVLGLSPFQLAMLSRSQHRSQDMGQARPPGPRYTRLMLLQNLTKAAPGKGLFAGIDTTLVGLAGGVPGARRQAARRELAEYRAAVQEARDSLRALDPGAAGRPLQRAVEAIDSARAMAAGADPAVRAALDRQVRLAGRALLSASGVTYRFRAEDDLWIPGTTVRVHAELWNGGSRPVHADAPALSLPDGWSARLLPADSVRAANPRRPGFYGVAPAAAGGDSGLQLPAGRLARWTFDVHVPADARPTEEYFLRQDTVGDLYRWPENPSLRARPLDPPMATGRLSVLVGGGRAVSASGDVRYRGVDKARGEFWRPVYVVPRVSVAVEPGVLVWPTDGMDASHDSDRQVTVTVRSEAHDTLDLDVGLELPGGWTSDPASTKVVLDERGATESRSFTLRPAADGGQDGGSASAGREGPDGSRTFRIQAVARAAGRTAGEGHGPWTRQLTLLDYPHIDPVPLYHDATVRLERFPVRVDRTGRVGYVMGSGDAVPDAIRQLGLSVTMLGPDQLRSGDLSAFDVIVLGVRAYEVRKDLQSANQRLLDWVRAGGTLIVQYNKYEYVDGGYPPYPATMAHPHDRVTDEHAPVTLLHPDAPALSEPNRIGPGDFEGWIQERGLYFLHSWDDRYTPLLSMRDAGEAPKEGSLLVATLGKGVYVYTGLDFFRELPAGVPGAYRLFANLLSLRPAAWHRWKEGAGGGS
ncbi:MAG: PIG-L family deacetylase [Candidatus Palauibacterales bacterium]|nr:PIG-L family deacetylase [Candidatus Palauibacterales bacterium]MDP2528714.1 PIG-L family deacetylase [Candidatus Palauibacterales bacterium]MDP2585240.1 PIG-L family deacetylase [Candidatus Palauibacterales bacterium]